MGLATDAAPAAVVVRHTFIDLAAEPGDPRGRTASEPPPRRRVASDKAYAPQLGRLNAAWHGARAQQPHGLAPAPAQMPPKSAAEASTESLPAWGSSLSPRTAVLSQSSLEYSSGGGDCTGDPADAQVPLDADGGYASLGSRGHSAGTCRPCAFVRSASGCKLGVACDFCHVVDEHIAVTRLRPSKGKRNRVRKAVASIEEQVARDPELLSRGDLRLPKLVDLNPWARGRVSAMLAQLTAADDAGATGGSGSCGRGGHGGKRVLLSL